MVWIPHLNKCCCVFTIKTAALILAWLYAIASTIATLTSLSVMLIFFNNDCQLTSHHIDLLWEFVAAVIVIAFLVSSVFNYLLLIGIYKENLFFMTPWVIINAMTRVISYIIGVILFFVAFLLSNMIYILAFIVVMAISTLFSYFYLVIFTYYRQLKREKERSDSAFKEI